MDSEEIRAEIEKLEREPATYQTCTRLSVLYNVYDHLPKESRVQPYSFGESEFLTNVSRAPMDEVMRLLDEHMDAVRIIFPKEYNVLINKIRSLSN